MLASGARSLRSLPLTVLGIATGAPPYAESCRPQDMQRASRRRSPAQRAAKATRSEAAEGGLRVGVGGAVVIKPNQATHLPRRAHAKQGPREPSGEARRACAAKATRSEAAEGGLRVGVGGAVVVKPTRRTALPTPRYQPSPAPKHHPGRAAVCSSVERPTLGCERAARLRIYGHETIPK